MNEPETESRNRHAHLKTVEGSDGSAAGRVDLLGSAGADAIAPASLGTRATGIRSATAARLTARGLRALTARTTAARVHPVTTAFSAATGAAVPGRIAA